MRNLPLKNKYFLHFRHWVERIVGSTSNSLELNDSGGQAADSQQQEAGETIPESRDLSQVLLDTDGKGHEPSEKNYVPWHNIHVEM